MYRENIYDVVKGTGENVSTLVIPKNSGLKGYAWKVMEEAGLKLKSAEEIGKNKLKVGDLTILLRRGEDIPQIVVDEFARGKLVLGLTGDDLYDEYRLRNPENPLRIENTYDWFDESARFFRPTLCLVNRTGNGEDIPLEARVAVDSKYERTSRNYLQTSALFNGKKPSVLVYNGDLESTVASGTNDCCIDVVYSGSTLQQDGLGIVQKIRFSDLVVISPLGREMALIWEAIQKEYLQIQARRENPTDSYTSKLLTGNPEDLFKDINREVMELSLAYYEVGKGELVGEAADVIFRILVALVRKDKPLNDLAREMTKRQK